MPHPKNDKQQQQPKDPSDKNEGEGSRTAARRYNEGVVKTVQSGKVDELAREAEEALEGPEGEELRDAEKDAKTKR
jgi:hypothetical protein